MKNCKLDSYDYRLDCEMGTIQAVIVKVENAADVDIADIASEITDCNGHIYVDGNYLLVNGAIGIIIESDSMGLKIPVKEN